MVVKSEEQMADTDCPTLCELDQKLAREFIMATISFFSNSLNQQRAMTPEQIKIMAYDMVDEFPNDSIVFVKLFFKKMRTGAFGNIYGTVDELTILNLYRKYRKEVISQYPMRKLQPKIAAQEVKELPEHDEAIPMPKWLQEKFGVTEIGQIVGSMQKQETNANHGSYKEKLDKAKTKEERMQIMNEYLKTTQS